MANYFEDRQVQHPGRIGLTPTEQADVYDISREEGTVTTQGTPFSANAFNRCIDLYGHYYGTCSTGASSGTKAVACSGFALETGATISVKFTNANTVTGTTSMNVNSTGAKQIQSILGPVRWAAGEVVPFVYDGTNWLIVGVTGYKKTTLKMVSFDGTTVEKNVLVER